MEAPTYEKSNHKKEENTINNPEGENFKCTIQFQGESRNETSNNIPYNSTNILPSQNELNNSETDFIAPVTTNFNPPQNVGSGNVYNSNGCKSDQAKNQSAPCAHYSLDLDIQISDCETCACFCCCIMGCLMLIFALFLFLKDSNNSSHSYNHQSGGDVLLLYNQHWLYTYGYDRDFIEPRMACNRRYHQVNTGCMGLKYPHDYKIKCKDCGFILLEGHDSGGLGAAIIFGFIGLILATLAIVFFLLY